MSRPYGLGLLTGIGMGMVLASGTLLLLYATGYGVTGITALLSWLGLFTTGLGLMLLLAPWLYSDPIEYPPTPPSTPSVTAPPQPQSQRFDTVRVNGIGAGVYHKYRPSTQEEAAWIDSATDFLLWVRQRGTLDSSTHVGLSVQNPNDWGDMIAPFEQHGAVLFRQKGVKTMFAPDWDATRLFNSVLAGYVQFPESKPPKVTPYPATKMTVDANGVDKRLPLEAQ